MSERPIPAIVVGVEYREVPAVTIDIFDQLDTALGPVAVMSLQQRGLIAPVGQITPPALSGSSDPDGIAVLRDRVLGALLGAAAGSRLGRAARRLDRDAAGFVTRDALDGFSTADARGRTGSETRQLRLAVEAALRAGWAQPSKLSDLLADAPAQFRRSAAITATVQRRRAGVAWFEAGVASYGNAALIRAVGAGLLHADDPVTVPVMASIDAAVTHASPAATDAAAVLATAVAGLVTRPVAADPDGLLCGLVEAARHATVRSALDQAIALGAIHSHEALPVLGLGPLAATTLAVGWWALLANPGDPAAAVAAAVSIPAEAPAIAAVTGALAGAAYGASALPDNWLAGIDTDGRLAAQAERILRRLGAHTPGSGWSPRSTSRSTTNRPAAPARPVTGEGAGEATDGDGTSSGADIWFLLDRSGSMQSIAGDVIGGFNSYFAEQQAQPGDATVSIIQFDSNDPEEVLIDRARLSDVRPIAAQQFQPRGTTPLFDAIGLLLDRAEHAGGHGADQLVVILTDGAENASHRWSRADLFERIADLTERGWTFVFLGANQDSYGTGGELGMAPGNISNYRPDPDSVHAVFGGTSRATTAWRSKTRARRAIDSRDFWGGRKEGEEGQQ